MWTYPPHNKDPGKILPFAERRPSWIIPLRKSGEDVLLDEEDVYAARKQDIPKLLMLSHPSTSLACSKSSYNRVLVNELVDCGKKMKSLRYWAPSHIPDLTQAWENFINVISGKGGYNFY